MTNKNPFEIRAEVLELAKEYMDKQTQMNIEYTEKMQELGKATYSELSEAYKPYTFEQLMEKAKEMYSFVSKKD
jgi:TRAP-type C4-dicarboxylate transport system substrate-binding protein